MKIRIGWPVIRQIDGKTRLGIDPETCLFFDDPVQAYQQTLQFLYYGGSPAGAKEAARRAGLKDAEWESLVHKLTRVGALAKTDKTSDNPALAAWEVGKAQGIFKPTGNGKKATFKSQENRRRTAPIYLRITSVPFLNQLVKQLQEIGFENLNKWILDTAVPPSALVVDIDGPLIDPDKYQVLMSSDVAHLPVTVVAPWRVEIGPLIQPGKTPCFRCMYLERANVDPGVVAALIQTSSQEHPRLDPSLTPFAVQEVVLQVLRWVEGFTENWKSTSQIEVLTRWNRCSATVAIQADCGCNPVF